MIYKAEVLWTKENGELITCREKIKVHQENMLELQSCLQEAFEDAVLMEISQKQFKEYLHILIEELQSPYS